MHIAKTFFVAVAVAAMVSGLQIRAQSMPDASQSMLAPASNMNSKAKRLTHKQARELRRQAWIMKHFDTNGDGILDNDEQAAMRAWSEHHRKSLLMHNKEQSIETKLQSANSPAAKTKPKTITKTANPQAANTQPARLPAHQSAPATK